MHLNAMHASCKAFIELEASEKLRKINPKMRTSTSLVYETDDTLHFKQSDSDCTSKYKLNMEEPHACRLQHVNQNYHRAVKVTIQMIRALIILANLYTIEIFNNSNYCPCSSTTSVP